MGIEIAKKIKKINKDNNYAIFYRIPPLHPQDVFPKPLMPHTIEKVCIFSTFSLKIVFTISGYVRMGIPLNSIKGGTMWVTLGQQKS